MFPAKAVQNGNILDSVLVNHSANDIGTVVKQCQQIIASGFEIHMGGNGSSEVADTDQNRVQFLIQTKNFSDLVLQGRDIVTIALLTKAAEAVKILTDLRAVSPIFSDSSREEIRLHPILASSPRKR